MKNRDWKEARSQTRGNHTVRPGHVRDQARHHGAREGRADRQRDARRRGGRDRQRRQIRAHWGAEGIQGRPLRTQAHSQSRQTRFEGAQAQRRGLRIRRHRTLPAARAERRGIPDRHVPGGCLHQTGRRHRPIAVGRPHALADIERQTQEGVRGHRLVGARGRWNRSVRTCSWTACGTSAPGAGTWRT